jgi:biuret amidohydrolase
MSHDCCSPIGRLSLLTALAGGATAIAAVGRTEAHAAEKPYADPTNPARPKAETVLDIACTELVVIDPQIDFMSPKGAAWAAVRESVTAQKLVPNLVRLFQASKRATSLRRSHHINYYPFDHWWKFAVPVEVVQHKLVTKPENVFVSIPTKGEHS